MEYFIYFHKSTTAAAVREALVGLYDIAPDRVFAGTQDELNELLRDEGVEYPLVIIEQEPGSLDEFDCRFEAYGNLAEAIGGIDVLHLAVALSEALKTKAVFEPEVANMGEWVLVTPDRWYGPVDLHEADHIDEGTRLDSSFQPVPSDPAIPVEPRPDWYTGPMHESGFLPAHADSE